MATAATAVQLSHSSHNSLWQAGNYLLNKLLFFCISTGSFGCPGWLQLQTAQIIYLNFFFFYVSTGSFGSGLLAATAIAPIIYLKNHYFFCVCTGSFSCLWLLLPKLFIKKIIIIFPVSTSSFGCLCLCLWL
jgi:hypothetical protein